MGSLRFVFRVIQIFVLLFAFSNCGHTQTIDDWNTRAGTLYPIDAMDFSNTLTILLKNNTAGGKTWQYTADNGALDEVWVTDGASPATLTWKPISSILPTDVVITDPATTGRNTVQPVNSSTVGISIKANGSGSAHQLDFQNSSGTVGSFFSHNAGLFLKPAADEIPLRVQNFNGSSTANLQTWEFDNGSSVSTLASIDINGNFSNTPQTLTTGQTQINGAATVTTSVTIGIPSSTAGLLKLAALSSANLVTIKAPTVPSAWTLTLPANGGTNGYLLKTDGTGLSNWVAPGSLGLGTVTSVDVSGGTTGLTTSGGPITTSGTITLAGTLAIANGGTGQTTANAAYAALSPMTTGGDMVYRNNTVPVRLAAGNAYEVMQIDHVSGFPSWGAVRLAQANAITGILPALNGGTGIDASAVTNGQLLIGKTSDNSLNLATITAGTGITVTNGAGTITIAASGGGGTVSSISNSDGTITLSPNPITTTGTVSLALGHSNLWGGASPAVQTFDADNLTTTPSNVIEFTNQTAATSSVKVQVSPFVQWLANLWNTTTTAATNQFYFREWLNGTSAASPTGTLTWDFNNKTVNNAWTTAMTLLSAGNGNGATLGIPLSNNTTNVNNALLIANGTAATSGVPDQFSGAIDLDARSWDGSASRLLSWRMYNLTANAASPKSSIVFEEKINGVSFSEQARITESGIISATSGFQINNTVGASGHVLRSNGTNYVDAAISASDIGSGTLPIVRGGTNSSSLTGSNRLMVYDGTSIVTLSNSGGGVLVNTGGGTTLPSWQAALDPTLGGTGIQGGLTQGMLIYVSASNAFSSLAKNGNATRYLANTGTNNNPAWAQVNLANGVTGTLSVANGGTGSTTQIIGPSLILGQSTTLPNVTRYVYPVGQATLSATLTTSTEFVAPKGMTLRNLYVVLSAAPGASQTTAVTVYVNGSAGNETVTISDPNTSGTDGSNTDVLNAGDLVTLQIVTSTTSAGTTLTYGIQATQ